MFPQIYFSAKAQQYFSKYYNFDVQNNSIFRKSIAISDDITSKLKFNSPEVELNISEKYKFSYGSWKELIKSGMVKVIVDNINSANYILFVTLEELPSITFLKDSKDMEADKNKYFKENQLFFVKKSSISQYSTYIQTQRTWQQVTSKLIK